MIGRSIRVLGGILLVLPLVAVLAHGAPDDNAPTVKIGNTVYTTLDDTKIKFEFQGAGQDRSALYLFEYTGEGDGVAGIQILSGTQVSIARGKSIRVWMKTNSCKIDGNARFESGTDLMIGPKMIHIDGEKGTLDIVGTKSVPAEAHLKVQVSGQEDPVVVDVISETIHVWGERASEDDNWELLGWETGGAAKAKVVTPEDGGAPVFLGGVGQGKGKAGSGQIDRKRSN